MNLLKLKSMRNSLPVKALESVFYPKRKYLQVGKNEEKFLIEDLTERFHLWNQMRNEKKVVEDIMQEVGQKDTFLDVGANHGFYSVFISEECKTYAVEPNPEFAEKLKKNRSNSDKDFKICEKALMEEEKTIYIDYMKPNKDTGTEAEACRGDKLFDGGKLESPDVIKIDVEGAELKVLKGFESNLEETKALYIEVHPNMMKKFDDNRSELQEFLEKKGFELEEMVKKGPRSIVKARKEI